MADRRLLTDRFLRALPPAPKGQRVEVWDSRLKGFGVRVTDAVDADPSRRGKAGTHQLHPVRKVLGRGGTGEAHHRHLWLDHAGGRAAHRRRVAQPDRQGHRSRRGRGGRPGEGSARAGAAHPAFVRHRRRSVHHRQAVAGAAAARWWSATSGASFVAAWCDRPISEITKFDVLEVINAKKRTAPQMARALLILITRFFNWAVDQHIYGLDTSPCDRLSRAKLIGEPPSRSRRLTDAELFAFWRATGRMRYPVGPAYRMLLLTGLRLNECAKLSWPEVHGDTIVIPAARMKGKNGKAREHLVPLSSAAQEVIASLPRYRGGTIPVQLQRRRAPGGDGQLRPSAIWTGACSGRSRRWPAVAARIITPSRCRTGPTTTCAASSAPVCRHFASRTTSRKPCLRTSHPASSAPTNVMSIGTRSARRWRRGRSTSRPSSTRRARQGRQAAGAAAMIKLFNFTYTDEQWDTDQDRRA